MGGEREREQEREDDLVRRLRDLDWPAPPPGLKERSLEEFKRRVERAEAEAREGEAAVRE